MDQNLFNSSCVLLITCSYIILLKVAHIADDANPDKHCSCAKKDAAHIVACEDLQKGWRGILDVLLTEMKGGHKRHCSLQESINQSRNRLSLP